MQDRCSCHCKGTLRGFGGGGANEFETKEVIMDLSDSLGWKLREDAGLRTQLSCMSFVYLTQLEAEAVAYGSKLKSRVVRAERVLVRDQGQTVQKWFLRVSKDRDNELLAQWARSRVDECMVGSMEDDKAIARPSWG